MNGQTLSLELALEGYQVEEAVASIFHTVLFYRTFGKFHYQENGKYVEGSVGYADVDCDFINLTYVKCSSPGLDRNIKRKVSEFSEELRNADGDNSGVISLKFFRKTRSTWLFPSQCVPWEVWNVHLKLLQLNNRHDQQLRRQKIGELLTEKIIFITEVVDRCKYMPDVPSQSDLCLVFDMSYDDCQPFLHEIVPKTSYVTPGPSTPSIGSVISNLFMPSRNSPF